MSVLIKCIFDGVWVQKGDNENPERQCNTTVVDYYILKRTRFKTGVCVLQNICCNHGKTYGSSIREADETPFRSSSSSSSFPLSFLHARRSLPMQSKHPPPGAAAARGDLLWLGGNGRGERQTSEEVTLCKGQLLMDIVLYYYSGVEKSAHSARAKTVR